MTGEEHRFAPDYRIVFKVTGEKPGIRLYLKLRINFTPSLSAATTVNLCDTDGMLKNLDEDDLQLIYRIVRSFRR